MKFRIKHFMPGRVRIRLESVKLSFEEADRLEYYYSKFPGVESVKVYERTGSMAVKFKKCESEESLVDPKLTYDFFRDLRSLNLDEIQAPDHILQTSSRALNAEYKEKLIMAVGKRLFLATFVPRPIGNIIVGIKAIKYIKEGIKCLAEKKLQVEVLDGIAIGTSIIRNDFSTAGSVMFLLGIGELLEEWTRKRSFGDLAKSMALNVTNVWLVDGEKELLVSADEIKVGDLVRVHMGNVIPFDSEVSEGEALVNQSSMTGESVPVSKTVGKTVYAGTVVEEGEILIRVRETSGGNKYDKIIAMIEGSEKMKSMSESKAEHMADKLVPYTLIGTLVTGLLTRNVTKAMAVLMVDFSCALKLAIPISVMTAIKDANKHNVTVKGGKFFEAVAEADTLVFDKTGTLTRATPTVKNIVPLGDISEKELLRIAACLEEHFPHSVAKAVVAEASKRGVIHDEMHSKVDYIVAHGIASFIDDKRVIIGSSHFVFDDEGCTVREESKEIFENLPKEYSHLYLAIDSVLEAVILIHDPIRPEAAEIIREIKSRGVKRVVMMTGDNKHIASVIAKEAGIDEFYAEVLPEDKAAFVESERAKGSKVIMVGDGINDTPALSAANVGIAISDGAEIAREIADIIIDEDDIGRIVPLIDISHQLMKRIKANYRDIVAINGGLIGLGVTGMVMPTTSAFIHNASTLAIGLHNMTSHLPEEK